MHLGTECWQVLHFHLIHFYNALESGPNRGIFFPQNVPWSERKQHENGVRWTRVHLFSLNQSSYERSHLPEEADCKEKNNSVCLKRAEKPWRKTALTPALSWPKVVKSKLSNNIKSSRITIAHSRLRALAAVVSWVDVHWCNRAPLPFCVPSELNHRLLRSMRIYTWKL